MFLSCATDTTLSASCACVELSTLISKRVDVPLPWRLRCRIARDALEGIVNLHNNECIHRDIKTDNFLVRVNARTEVLLSLQGFFYHVLHALISSVVLFSRTWSPIFPRPTPTWCVAD